MNSKLYENEHPQYGTLLRASLVKILCKLSSSTLEKNYQLGTLFFNRREKKHQGEYRQENEGMHPFKQIFCKEVDDNKRGIE